MPFAPALAIAAATTFSSGPSPSTEGGDRPQGITISKQVHDDWLVSVEAATHLPLDAGFQLGVETPFGLRVFGGYGWVPTAFVDLAARSAGGDSLTRAVLSSAHYSGQLARVSVGIRPFRNFGGYLDAGYAHAWLGGSQDIPAFTYSGLSFPGGSYVATSDIDIWLLELGYQGEVAGRLVLGVGLGVTGSLGARTTITPSSGAPTNSQVSEAGGQIDHALRTNVLPTLTFRVGFDLI